MKRLTITIFVIYYICFCLIFSLAHAKISHENPASITVLASSSMTHVITKLARIYSKQTGVIVSVIYSSPSELAEDIIAGDEADIYISEHPLRIDELKRQGLLDINTITTIAESHLVIAASPNTLMYRNTTPPTSLDAIFAQYYETEFVIPDKEFVPAGILAQRALEKLGYWKKIEPTLLPATTISNALYLIGKGRRAGVVYAPDALNNPDIEIMAEIPANLYEPIRYQAAVVAGPHMDTGRGFITFLQSHKAQNILKEYGFSMPNL